VLPGCCQGVVRGVSEGCQGVVKAQGVLSVCCQYHLREFLDTQGLYMLPSQNQKQRRIALYLLVKVDVVRVLLSVCCQSVVRVLSGCCQGVGRELSECCQGVVRGLSGGVVRVLSIWG